MEHFRNFERGGHYIIKEFNDENEAFDYFHEFILNRFKNS